MVPTGTNDQHTQLRREALNIVEDSIEDMSTCVRGFKRCTFSSRLLCITLE